MNKINLPKGCNRVLFQAENLSILQALNSESVDLVVADPPLSRGGKGDAHDRWQWDKDIHESWLDELQDDWPDILDAIKIIRATHGDSVGAAACYLAVRLIAMRRVLRSDGSIYMNCKSSNYAHYWLKLLMDSIFDRRNFLNEIVVCGDARRRTRKRSKWAQTHYVQLWYAKDRRRFSADCSVPPSDSKDGGGEGVSFAHGADWWGDIPSAMKKDAPIELYEKIIRTASSEGAIVLDPFCAAGTALAAAAKLRRRYIGVDLRADMHRVVSDRMKAEGLPGALCRTRAPKRTDDGKVAVPFLRAIKASAGKGRVMSHKKMLEHLLNEHGCKCQGCNRKFDDARYLELDHNAPRADGGSNDLSNRVLLCGPCNRAKRHTLTLSGLRELNRKNGWLLDE